MGGNYRKIKLGPVCSVSVMAGCSSPAVLLVLH